MKKENMSYDQIKTCIRQKSSTASVNTGPASLTEYRWWQWLCRITNITYSNAWLSENVQL